MLSNDQRVRRNVPEPLAPGRGEHDEDAEEHVHEEEHGGPERGSPRTRGTAVLFPDDLYPEERLTEGLTEVPVEERGVGEVEGAPEEHVEECQHEYEHEAARREEERDEGGGGERERKEVVYQTGRGATARDADIRGPRRSRRDRVFRRARLLARRTLQDGLLPFPGVFAAGS